jgi:predicted Zn-dependent protease
MLLTRAGFDPNGMWQFFEVLQRQHGTANEADVPAILRSHPVTAERIAETRSRARTAGADAKDDSLSYSMMRERMRVIMTPAGQDARQYYSGSDREAARNGIAQLYGKALAGINSGAADEAVRIMKTLQSRDRRRTYHSARWRSWAVIAREHETLARARELFPRNVPITVRYAEVLLRVGEAKRAHEVLLDLFNNVPPTPDQAKLIALAANSAGEAIAARAFGGSFADGQLLLPGVMSRKKQVVPPLAAALT